MKGSCDFDLRKSLSAEVHTSGRPCPAHPSKEQVSVFAVDQPNGLLSAYDGVLPQSTTQAHDEGDSNQRRKKHARESREVRRLLDSPAFAAVLPAWHWQLLAGLAAVALAVMAIHKLSCSWQQRQGSWHSEDEQQGAEVKQPGMPPKDSFIAALWMKAVKGAGKRRTSPPPTGASERSLAYACSSASESSCIRRGPAYRLDPSGGHRFLPSTVLAERLRQQSLASCESLEITCGRDPKSGSSGAASRWSLEASWEADSWKLDPEDVQICLDSKNRPWQLGSGGFGRVFRAELAGSTPVAVKFVTRQSPRELRRFVHEIGILKSLRHTNVVQLPAVDEAATPNRQVPEQAVVQFLGAFLDRDQMILVTEYMAGGDLYNVMGHDMSRSFSWYKRGQQAALDIVRGLVHMHARKVVHLDLKSANILLSRDGMAKIADVGLAKVLSREITNVSMESTFDWAAPEVLAGVTCSEKADIWSLGVVLWEIVTGEAPKLRQLRPLRVPEECPEEVRDVIVACRTSEPEARPTAREVFARLSAIANTNSPLPARCIISAAPLEAAIRGQPRPLWAPAEHPSGEENPSYAGRLAEYEPNLNGGWHQRWGADVGGRLYHPPAWIRSQHEARSYQLRATSV